jgi:putative ABC transport system permease protein
MIEDYLRMAFQNLRGRKLRSWLTMLGIFIGIATIVSLISLGEGLKSTVVNQFSFLSPGAIVVTSSGAAFGSTIDGFTERDFRAITRISGVRGIAPRRAQSLNFIYEDRAIPTRVMTIPSGKRRDIANEVMTLNAEEGNLLEDGDKFKVLVGYGLAKESGFDREMRPGSSIEINGQTFEVAGVNEKKGSFLFDYVLFMNEDAFFDLFDVDEDVYFEVPVLASTDDDVTLIAEHIEEALRDVRNVDEDSQDFSVTTAQEALENLESTIFAVQLFLYIIAGISIVVGGIGIMNTMYSSVLERTKEIGVMKSIGATNRTIFLLFFIESGFLGMVGGLIGIILGVILGLGAESAAKVALGNDLVTAQFSVALILGALLFSFLLGSLSGIFPALQAAKKHPVQALRGGH